jgi:hypothetical protein
MQKVQIELPIESYSLIEFSQDDKPGIMTVNAALKDFQHKKIFPWHLSLMLSFNDKVADAMPSKTEHDILMQFEEQLGNHITAAGNALFLSSITHNGVRELIWRVYQPEIANDYLHDLIDSEDHPRAFSFTLEQDSHWEKAAFPLDSLDAELTPQTL